MSFRNKKFGRTSLVLVRYFYRNEVIGEVAAPGVCVLSTGFPASQVLFPLAVHSPWQEKSDTY